MVDVSGVVAPTGAFGWVYDPTRDVIHIVTTAGVLTDYSVATKANVFSQNLGGTPNDVEISQDGRFLLVGNSALTGGQATVTRVDLATHGLSTINVPVVSTSTPATGSLAVGYDGTAYVGLRGGGSFDNPFRSFAVDAVIPITSPVSLAPSFYSSAEVLSSEDHRYLLLQDLGISSGPLRLYDSVAGLTVASTDLYALNTSGYQAGRGDVSSAAHLVVDMWYTGLLVLDLNLHLVQDLSSQQRAGSVIGVAFNEGGHQLFLWKGEDKTVLVLDTQSWRQVGSLAVTTSASFGSNSPYGAMDVTAGGRALILDADTRLEILDLTRMSLTVGGDATSQALYGAIGPDQISAAGGADTLAGGGGRDTLSGGADGDLFLFAPGDSAAVDGESDVIIDWEASDRLTFGGAAGTAVNYVEGAAGSFGAALSFAGSQIAGGAADYVAVQVGADVVVFADSRNDNGAADEAVVLRGRGLADIAASNIAAGPPPPPPAFQLGGAGNDTLVAGAAEQLLAGGDGDDLLVGGAAANTLNGGAGLDTVSYASATGPVRLNLATSAVQNVGSGHGSDIIIQVERLIGGAFGDSLTGTAGTDTLVGGDGGDSVLGGGGVDLLTGDGGDDTLSGGGTLSGGAGRDVLQGGAGADVLGGGEGDDSIAGGGGVDLLAGDGGADTLAGSGTLTGGAGLDVLTSTLAGTVVQGGDDADRISGAGGTWLGEGGDDTLTVTSGAGSLDGGSGADSLTGSAGADSLAGQDGDDVARGGGGADTLSGGAGADTLAGGTGRDLISGGAGADRIEIAVGDSVAAGGFDAIDVIQDWDATDSLVFAGGGVRGSAYFETSAADYALAYFNANLKIQTGQANFVAVQVGSDVVVFADSNNDNGTADSAVVLAGRGLADIDEANFVAAPPEATVAPPPPVLRGPFSASGRVVGDMDAAHIGALLGAEIDAFDSELLLIGRSASADVVGTGFTYDSNEQITGGSVRGVALLLGAFQANITIPAGVSAVSFGRWVATDATQEAFATVLAGADSLTGGSGAELLRGYGGGDLLAGNGGADTIYGGLGDDVIYALAPGVTGGSSPPGTYLRGDEGDDYILGGSGFDDANGNMGNDTVSTGAGDDYCVGGKDNDVLFGDAGADLVYGNLGNDTCEGGDGNDIVRGGQDNDSCVGGAGDDFVSGDKGDDTMTGGAGADIFHTFGDAGLDRVTDFSLAQGDRVMLDPGTVFTVSQVGADTVINMTGGGQMILVGVSMGTLTPGWIFGG